MNYVTEMRKVDFEVLQREYLKYIDVADKTVDTYDVGIRQFIRFLKNNEIVTPTRDDVLDFKNYLKENGYAIATINSYLIALRNFFKFLEYNGIYKNITDNVKSLKDGELHKRNALTIEQTQKVISQAKNIREKAMLYVALSCGLRANELVNIQLKDFVYENGKCCLYVLGKGRNDKIDYVIVPDEVLRVVNDYIKEYEVTDYLFMSISPNNYGNRITVRSIERIINGIYERAGVKTDKITLHSLRHTFCTVAIKSGQNLREVSKAMRHKSVVVTERYSHDLEMQNNTCSSTVFNAILGE